MTEPTPLPGATESGERELTPAERGPRPELGNDFWEPVERGSLSQPDGKYMISVAHQVSTHENVVGLGTEGESTREAFLDVRIVAGDDPADARSVFIHQWQAENGREMPEGVKIKVQSLRYFGEIKTTRYSRQLEFD